MKQDNNIKNIIAVCLVTASLGPWVYAHTPQTSETHGKRSSSGEFATGLRGGANTHQSIARRLLADDSEKNLMQTIHFAGWLLCLIPMLLLPVFAFRLYGMVHRHRKTSRLS
jgi:hypothetical protein